MTVLTVGETMALLAAVEEGEFRLGMPLTLRFAGAESNFAIGLARLGVDVVWVSRLGRDPFGDLIEAGLAHEGIDLRWVRRGDAPTRLFLQWGIRGGSSRPPPPARPAPPPRRPGGRTDETRPGAA